MVQYLNEMSVVRRWGKRTFVKEIKKKKLLRFPKKGTWASTLTKMDEIGT